MATGNDTLVKSSTQVYENNMMLEREFGGESIIVLYEAENLLTPDNLKHMKGLENILQTNHSIYSTISPVTLVEEIANKQSDQVTEGIAEIIDGLKTMGNHLTEIGTELQAYDKDRQMIKFPGLKEGQLPQLGAAESPELEGFQMPDFSGLHISGFGEIQLQDMEEKLTELNNGFSNIIESQNNLGDGTKNLIEGYTRFGKEIEKISENLNVLSKQIADHALQEQLQEVSLGLTQLSKQMVDTSEDSSQLSIVPNKTIEGLKEMQQNLNEQIKEQEERMQYEQEQVKEQLQKELEDKQVQMKQKMEEQQLERKEDMKTQIAEQQKQLKKKMLAQQSEKEKQMQELQEEMQGKQDEQVEKLSTLSEGLSEMGDKLQTMSEKMETIYDYSDTMTPNLPTKQATLDRMVFDDGELRPMFKEVVIDDHHMLMMIRFKGDTDDTDKSEVIEMINTYLNDEQNDSLKTIVSGKPVLDHAIRSSMKESMQKMMGLALLIMIVVLSLIFKVRWRLLPLVIVLIAVIGTVGLMGWLQIPITMVSMAVFPILIGLGIDYTIQFQNRYVEEMAKEDTNE